MHANSLRHFTLNFHQQKGHDERHSHKYEHEQHLRVAFQCGGQGDADGDTAFRLGAWRSEEHAGVRTQQQLLLALLICCLSLALFASS